MKRELARRKVFDMDTRTPEHTVSGGNVFADLGLPNAEELQAKAVLANQIASIVTHRHLTQVEAARILGTGQPKVSELLAGRLDGFSIERLIRYLNALDRDVQIVVPGSTVGRTSSSSGLLRKPLNCQTLAAPTSEPRCRSTSLS
jgi:predicted XRE-type DNA-binding protein